MLNVLKEKYGENIILAVIPIVGYIVALFYQYGYANYFEFPLDFIGIDLKMTLTSSLWVAVYLCAIAFFFDFYSSFVGSANVFSKIIKNVLHFSILPFIGMFVTAFDQSMFFLFLVSILIGLILCIVPPLFNMKKIGYKKALINGLNENNFEGSERSSTPSFFENYISYFLLLLVFIGVCHGAGKYNAEQKKDFYVFNYEGQKYVLVASYGDYFVASKIEDEKYKITKEFSIFNPSQQFISGLKKIEITSK